MREYRDGDTIWVHDYQLMLLPALLRSRLPHARIGFFLHIPFPSSEVFRILPWRRKVLRGLLGADLIGFHTFAYMRHFLAALLHVEGVEADIDRVRLDGPESRLGVFPMGVDAGRFPKSGRTRRASPMPKPARDAGGRQIVLGIDRLDYTKGIPRRLAAIERLSSANARLADRVRYIQVAVPSRAKWTHIAVQTSGRGERRPHQRRVRHTRSTPVHYMHIRLADGSSSRSTAPRT